MPKLQKNKDGYTLRIPKDLVLRKGWAKGQKLFLVFNEKGRIEIME